MRRLLAALAACSLLVAACGDDDDVATDVGQGAETTSTTTTPTTESTMPVELVTDLPDELPAGELELRFDAVNVSDEPVSLSFPSGQEGDAHLLDADGESVYTWSATRSFTQVIQERTLEAGEAYSVALDADLRDVAPGTYTLELSLAVQDPPPPLQLEVTIVEP